MKSAEKATATEVALARQALNNFNLAKDMTRAVHRLKSANVDLHRQSIRDFLTKKGVSDSVISIAEDDAKNRPRAPKGRRYSESVMGISIAFHRAGGSRSLNVASQLWITPTSRRTNSLVQKVVLYAGIGDGPLPATLRHLVSQEDRDFRTVSLIFDETHVPKQLIPVPKEGLIFGFMDLGNGKRFPKYADKVFLMQVQGIIVNWVFPVFYMLSASQLSAVDLCEELPNSICYLEGLVLDVVLVGCDQGSSNVSAVNELLVTRPVPHEEDEVPHEFEVDGKNIIAIYDIAHLAKCLRDRNRVKKNYVDAAISWPIGFDDEGLPQMTELRWSMFTKLRDIVVSPHLNNKLTKDHLEPQFKRKMKVKYAMELYSGQNSRLFKAVGDDVLPGSSDASLIVAEIDELNDLMNGHTSAEARSGTIREARRSMSSTSLHSTRLREFCTKMKYAQFYNYSKDGTRGIAAPSPTAHSYRQTMCGLLKLHQRLSDGHDSVNPRNVTSCPIEGTFSEGKMQGGTNRRPNAHQFIAYLKSITIYKCLATRTKSGNCQYDGRNAHETSNLFPPFRSYKQCAFGWCSC